MRPWIPRFFHRALGLGRTEAVPSAPAPTERANAPRSALEDQLLRSQADLSALLESTRDLIWSVDLSFGLVTFNSTLAEHFRANYGTRAFVGARPEQLIPPDLAAKWPALYERALRQGPFHLDYGLPDGRFLELSFNPIQQEGQPVGVSVFGKDITDRKRIEQDLQDSRAGIKALIESTTDLIWSVDLDYRLTAFNSTFATYFQDTYGTRPVVGRRPQHLLPEERAAKWPPRYERLLAQGRFQATDTLPDGRVLEFTLNPVAHDGRTVGIAVFGKDVTAQVQAAQALRQSEEKLRNIVDRAPMGVFRRDLDGRYVTISRGLLEQLECRSEEEFLATYGTLENRWAHPDKHEEFLDLLLREHQVLGFEVETRLASGRTKYFLLYVHLDLAAPNFMDGFSVDITELKTAEHERQKILEELHHNQKMEAIGQLAGGVAHDFNNMLGGIIGATDFLRNAQPGLPQEKRDAYLDLILSAASRAADLTAKLLAFSRKGQKASTAVEVVKLVQETVAILKSTLDKRIDVTLEDRVGSATVIGDDSMLQSVLMNMGINASHAMPQGGALVLVVGSVDLDGPYCAASPFELTPGPYIEIEVRDTGCGMTPEVQRRIFEPFFTTKASGEGTGLGLAAAYGTILDHHGAIHVYSEPGVGTAFHVYLPLAEGAPAVPLPAEAAAHGTGTVLVVDDEEFLRIITQTMLEELGYTVLTAKDGWEGVERFRTCHQDLDLVILDMIMPIMGGRQAFEAMHAFDPEVPIVLASGLSRSEDFEEMKRLGLRGFLRKPCRMSELGRVVGDLVKARREAS